MITWMNNHVWHCSLISIHGTSTTFAFSISVCLSWIQDSIYEYSVLFLSMLYQKCQTTSENPLPKTKIIVNNSHTHEKVLSNNWEFQFFFLFSLSHSCTFNATRFVCIVQTLSPSDTLLIYIFSTKLYNNSEQIDFICFCLPLKWHFVISIKHLWYRATKKKLFGALMPEQILY